MGPHYGSAKGTLEGRKSINENEQAAIKKALNDLDLPVVDLEYEVNDSGAKAKLDDPWAGIRASIGIVTVFIDLFFILVNPFGSGFTLHSFYSYLIKRIYTSPEASAELTEGNPFCKQKSHSW